MTVSNDRDLYKKLQAPFQVEDVRFRAIQTKFFDGVKKCRFVPFVRKDAVQRRLDDVMGLHWEVSYVTSPSDHMPGLFCHLTLMFEDQAITRTGADYQWNEQTRKDRETGEEFKTSYTLASSATKAFVSASESFGIGKELYGLMTGWIECDQYGNPLKNLTLEDCFLKGSSPNKKSTPSTGLTQSESQENTASVPRTSMAPSNKVAAKPAQSSNGVDYLTQVWPFGKHKGKVVKDIDGTYWDWAMENLPQANPKDEKFRQDVYEMVVAGYNREHGFSGSLEGTADDVERLIKFGQQVGVSEMDVLEVLQQRFELVMDIDEGTVEPFDLNKQDEMMTAIQELGNAQRKQMVGAA